MGLFGKKTTGKATKASGGDYLDWQMANKKQYSKLEDAMIKEHKLYQSSKTLDAKKKHITAAIKAHGDLKKWCDKNGKHGKKYYKDMWGFIGHEAKFNTLLADVEKKIAAGK